MIDGPPPAIFDSLDAPELATEAYILDVWGVLWDGIQAYPEAAQCLAEIRRQHKRVLLLSNAPRRSFRVVRSLDRIGIGENLFDGILTSGDLCREACAAGIGGLGSSYHYVGLEKDRGLLDGLSFCEAGDIDTADFVLNLGTRRLGDTAKMYLPELGEAVRRGLPMLCANPDEIIVRSDGTRVECAGALARLYEELGGSVQSFGKPLRQTYESCFAKLRAWNPAIAPDDVLAIGDSLTTDIRGGADAGFRAVLVAGGIHREELGIRKHGDRPDPERIAALTQREGIRPAAILSLFQWRIPNKGSDRRPGQFIRSKALS